MRKTSHDGGDSTSITSGVENEIKKSAMKPKKTSLKRKAPNFSQESDDTVIEPLLQKDKEKTEPQSAKYFGKGKTDSTQNKESDNKAKTTTNTGFCGTTETLLSFKESEISKTNTAMDPPLHNYMNTNVFNTHDNTKVNATSKSQILVEIDSSKQNSYTPSPLIFTTAKIHTDAKTKQMEPVHVTPVPILSTIEVSLSKGGNITTNEKKISNGSSVINPVYSPIPLNKCKEEKIAGACATTSISPTINKDMFGNTATVTSAANNIICNITTQISSMKNILTPTTSDSLSMKSNTNDNQEIVKHIKNEPHNISPKQFNLDITKNNVAVKTMTPSSEKVIEVSTTKTSQANKSKIQQPRKSDKGTVNTSSYNSEKNTSTVVGVSNTAKNMTNGNKQLQRQKTTTEETLDTGSKEESNIVNFNITSAKGQSLSHPKVKDSISITDKLSNVSANNSPNATTKINDTVSSVSKTTPILMNTKPTATSIVLSNTVTITDVSTKPVTQNTESNNIQTISQPTTSTKEISNINRISNAPAISPSNINSKDNIIPASHDTDKWAKVTTIQTQTSINKTSHEKSPEIISVEETTTPGSYEKIKTAKHSPAVLPTVTTVTTQPLSNTKTKVTDPKPLSVTTSTKMTLASSITSIDTKPSSSTITKISSFKQPVTSSLDIVVKTPTVTTSIPKTLSSTGDPISKITQSATTISESASKQGITAVNTTATKSASSAKGKTSTANSSIPPFITTGVKSPNNNSSQVFGPSKPSTASIPSINSILKTDPIMTLPKIPAESSSTNVTVSTNKSPHGISLAKTNTNDTSASVKKSAATKSSIITKSSPVGSVNKSAAGITAKASSPEVPMSSAAKKSTASVLAKTSSISSSTKTPSVTTLTKTSDIPASSSTSTSSSAKSAMSATQVSATRKKSVGAAGSCLPSSAPGLISSESTKKSGSKSSENNKDGKVSKA